MTSTEPDALRLQYESMRKRMSDNPAMDLADLRSMFDELADQSSEPEGVSFVEDAAIPMGGIWCTPVDAVGDGTILYLHGGGYMGNSAATHRKIAGHLAAWSGRRTFVLNYPLAPEHPFPAQLESAAFAVRWLTDTLGIDHSRLIFAGDSSGANLALGLCVHLATSKQGLPAGLALFSPWVDLLNQGQSLDSNSETDALISVPMLELMTSMFLGTEGSPTDPRANALFADLTDFPPMFVAAGADEALLDDARRLADRAAAHGIDVELTIAAHQQHAYPIKAGHCSAADSTLSSAGSFIRSVLG